MSPMLRLVLLATLPALLLGSGIAATVSTSGHRGSGPVYSVAAVQARLADDPRAWVGRTVWVRGRAIACALRSEREHLRCVPTAPRLADPDAASVGTPLLLREEPEPLPDLLRRAPFLGSVLPAPRVVVWWRVAVYWVRLQAGAAGRCGAAPCYVAWLLDTIPDPVGDGRQRAWRE